ncbi:coiled-coil domain-containing protein 146 isoform X2 [Gouania willdenowi]|uniref:Coiled-coil domain-containing protein 146 n=1 Tax=Gouania willdenowi TaxID=441366 RepID=A0A8C5DD76_GOUWI|nr:coiled-coil domain-containing protein 146 isoform X2 [Gouania willdenowi]
MNPSGNQRDIQPPSGEDVEVEEQEEETLWMEGFPLTALPPDLLFPETKPCTDADVASCSAFQCLEELLSSGKISATKAGNLKATYTALHNTLKSAQDKEDHILEKAKKYRAELGKLQAEMRRADEQSSCEEPESEVNILRQQFLQACNELKAAEERGYETQHQLKCLWEEKEFLRKENEIQTKPAEIESITKTLRDKYEDLKQEVLQRQLEIRSLMEDMEINDMQISREQKELQDKKGIIEFKEAESARLISIPDQIIKETERKRSKKEAAVKKTEELNKEISESEQRVKAMIELNRSLRMRNEEVIQELEARRTQVETSEREGRQLQKEIEMSKEEAGEITGTRGILEMKLKNVVCDKKYLHESLSVQLREKNRLAQALKRMEHALTMATEQLGHSQCIYNDLRAQLNAIPKREASLQQRMELQKEVDALKEGFLKQLFVAEEQGQKEQQYGMIQELLKQSNRLREKLHNLRCLTQIKAEERGQKHRELLRAQELNQLIQQELREKELIIMDQHKLNSVLQRRISQYSKLCAMMMEEKRKYVNLKEITSHTVTELAEQIKILENEIEIQQSFVINKERSCTKVSMKISSSTKARDKLRNDISKVSWRLTQMCQESEDSKRERMKLNQTIKLQEETLLEINKDHETAIGQRNSLGIQLLEHDDVLFNYNKKLATQEAAIIKGNMTLETLQNDMNDLQLAIKEKKRQIVLKTNEMLHGRELEDEITMLQIELSEARDKTLEGLNQAVEYKELKGKDPSMMELVKKVEQLELKITERENQLMEKELLVDQVTRLSNPIRDQVENCRDVGLLLAKKLNEVRTNITNTNNRLMGVTAELSMTQAMVLSQQQQIKEKELQMDRCQRALEQDLPLDVEMEEEWRRMLRDKKRRQKDKEDSSKLAEEEEWNQLPNGVYTTAEPRPNAYIPTNDPLPLPKPYGAHAPFKPSQPGANMRHIRKPAPEPMET